MGEPYRTGDQALVREINLSIILNCLRETSPLSRARLAEITGLSKTTVSSLVRELISPILGIGVGVPGLMDVSSGTLLLAPNPKWRDVPLHEVFSQEFDVPSSLTTMPMCRPGRKVFWGGPAQQGFHPPKHQSWAGW